MKKNPIYSSSSKRKKRKVILLKLALLAIFILWRSGPLLAGTNLHVFVSEQIKKKEVRGKVTDTKGEPIPGTTVIVKGTTIGTTTDFEGNFSLQVPLDSKAFLFSFIGYKPLEVPIGGETTFTIQLEEQTFGLGEVVAVGYGAQKKQSVVGAIDVVSDKDLEARGGVYNLAQAISGQIGGVVVMEKTGEPGREDPEILIRGKSTWNGSQPLILVDGIERPMSDIDVNEVSSISVLKDASATAVFGVKGANGVILITTKRGEVGRPKLTFSASVGFKSLSKVNTTMEAYSAQSWRNEAVRHEIATNEAAWQYFIPYEQLIRSKKPQVEPYTYLYPNVDWLDVMFKDYAKNSRYNMNLSGGTEFVKYFASLGYLSEGDLLRSEYNSVKGYDPGFSYKRFNFRGNLDFNLTKTTVLSTNLSGYFGTRKGPAANFSGGLGTYGHIWRGYYELPPDAFPVKYPDGNYGKDPAAVNMQNPIAILQEGGVTNTNRRQLSTELKIVQKLDFVTKGLSVSANVAYDSYAISTGPGIYDGSSEGQALYTYISPDILEAKTAQDSLNAIFYYATGGKTGINDFDFVMQPWTVSPETVNDNELSRSLFYQAAVNYSRVFGGHDITALFLFNRQQNTTGGGFAHYREDWVGRLTYNYRETYFAEFNGAYNGSEKFSSRYRFGFFPSMALGWLVSNERFMEQAGWITKLKIRGSIGQVGSDAGIPRWGYVGSWNSRNASAFGTRFFSSNGAINGSPYSQYVEGTIPNPEIRWETAVKRNIGAEVAVLNRLITLDLDLFKDSRENIFMSAEKRNIPNYFGAPAVAANLGATETKGYEVELGLNKTFPNDIGLWMKLGMTKASDLVTKSEDPALLQDYQKVAGFPIDQTKTQIRSGFMNNWDDVFASAASTSNMNQRLPGDWDMVDFNGDGMIDSYDVVPFGYPTRPQKTYSGTFGLTFKGLAFMVQFYGVRNINLVPRISTPGLTRWVSVSDQLGDYWTPQNTDANYKAPRLTTTSNLGDWQVQDASYIRLKTMEISYTLPPALTNFLDITSCRIYVNGNNLYLWSDFPADFETGTVDIQNAYPMTKQINLGIDISF